MPKKAPWRAAVWRRDSRAFNTLAFWQAWLDDIRPHVPCAGTMETAVAKWSHPKDQIFGWLGMTAIDNLKNMRGMDAWSFRAALAQGSVGVGLCWSDGTKAGQEKPLDKQDEAFEQWWPILFIDVPGADLILMYCPALGWMRASPWYVQRCRVHMIGTLEDIFLRTKSNGRDHEDKSSGSDKRSSQGAPPPSKLAGMHVQPSKLGSISEAEEMGKIDMDTPNTHRGQDLHHHFRTTLEMVDNMPDTNPDEFLAKHRKMQLLWDEVRSCREAIICELVNKYPCSEICEVLEIVTEKTDILIERIKLAKASLRQGRAPKVSAANFAEFGKIRAAVAADPNCPAKLRPAEFEPQSPRISEASTACPSSCAVGEPQSPRISEASTACPSSCAVGEPQSPRTAGATQSETLQRASGTLRAVRDAWHPHGSGCDTQLAVFPGDMLCVEWRQSPEEGGFWAWGLNIKQQAWGYFPIACLDI
jgi:hypothetical protein